MLSRYSHSSLGTWRTCPRKFKFNYIERIKVPDRVTPDAYLGSSVHRVLNKLYSLGADGIVIPLEDVMQMYNEEWKKVDLNAIALIKDFYTVDDYIRLGREMITRHYEKYSPFRFGTLLGTELKLTFDIPKTPFKGNAIIDKLLKLDDGTIQIIDYKTGKNIPKVTDPAFRYQMGFYQIAVQQNFPQYKNIEQVQIYLRPDETITHKVSEDELD
ncbi:MAG: PD-(D/E)XK nuclease family protein, partial [candidate division Zixibacteria bacterium]|nr:PD-(D/E)XK nuclease family protein [candidate division Zixibacteria bacterium]